jgi:hypothetical protein
LKGIDLAEGDFHLYPFTERAKIAEIALPIYRDNTSFLSDGSRPALIHKVNKKIANGVFTDIV